jgi:hypothetical protein
MADAIVGSGPNFVHAIFLVSIDIATGGRVYRSSRQPVACRIRDVTCHRVAQL